MTVASIPLDKAYLTAIWLETLFYGINLSLFVSYIYIVTYKRRAQRKTIILIMAIMMFIFSTIHVSMGFSRLIEGFIYLRDQPGGPGAFFSDVSIPANVAKVIIHTINSVLGDSIVVWRCYHVWGRDWKVCMWPVLLIIGSAVCGFGQGIVFAEAKTTHSAFEATLEKWNGSLFVMSLITNVTVTSLIAARIWWMSRKIKGVVLSSFQYERVLALVVESGAIYSSALVIEITLYFLNTNAFYIVYDPIAQLTGIVPTMIIVLTSLGLTTNDLNSRAVEDNTKPTGTKSTAMPRFFVPNSVTSMTGTTAGYSFEPERTRSDRVGEDKTVAQTIDIEKGEEKVFVVTRPVN